MEFEKMEQRKRSEEDFHKAQIGGMTTCEQPMGKRARTAKDDVLLLAEHLHNRAGNLEALARNLPDEMSGSATEALKQLVALATKVLDY